MFRKIVVLFISFSFIFLPNGLRRDILLAVNNVRLTREKPGKKEKLFAYLSNTARVNENLNTWFCSFLKKYDIIDIDKDTRTYQIEPISKSAIVLMVNPAAISKITGVKIAQLENTYYTGAQDFYVSESMTDVINWEIAKNDYYTYI